MVQKPLNTNNDKSAANNLQNKPLVKIKIIRHHADDSLSLKTKLKIIFRSIGARHLGCMGSTHLILRLSQLDNVCACNSTFNYHKKRHWFIVFMIIFTHNNVVPLTQQDINFQLITAGPIQKENSNEVNNMMPVGNRGWNLSVSWFHSFVAVTQ